MRCSVSRDRTFHLGLNSFSDLMRIQKVKNHMLGDHLNEYIVPRTRSLECGFTHQTRDHFRYSERVRGVAARHQIFTSMGVQGRQYER